MDVDAASIAASMAGKTSSPVRNHFQVVLCGSGIAGRIGGPHVICKRQARSWTKMN
jgi:hypothetical protein